MRANISAWAIRRPIPPILLMIILSLLGLVAFFNMNIDQSPNVDVPLVLVSVSESGAATAELEAQVTRLVENAIANIGGVKHIGSAVRDSLSRTQIEFNLDVPTDRAVEDVRNAVSKIRPELPANIDEPVVERVNITNADVVAFAVGSSSMTDTELGWFVDNQVSRAMLTLPGVGGVVRSGGSTRELVIELDPDRLNGLGVTVVDVNDQLRSTNANLPGGLTKVGKSEQIVRAVGSSSSVDTLANTAITLSNGRKARLNSLGRVTDSFSEVRSAATLDGKPVVSFAIQRSPNVSVVAVSDQVDAMVEKLRKANPTVAFHRIFSIADNAKRAYDASMEALELGAFLSAVVVLIFLRDWRATFIVGMAMPLSLLPTFFVIRALGYTLNWCSLLAFTLVVGVLVDDAIVEIENIVRHVRMGKSPYQAALDAADEIGLAVVATTMTIVAVFLPLSLMSGVSGQFFRQFGFTVSIAVLFSLLVARLITPMMAAHLGRAHPERKRSSGRVGAAYVSLLDLALRHRWISAGCGAAFFIGSLCLIPLLPTDFLPDQDNGISSLFVELPPGATIDDSRTAVTQITTIATRDPTVEHVFAVIGGDANFGQVRQAHITLLFKPRAQRALRQSQIEKNLSAAFHDIPGIHYNFGQSNNGGQALQIILSGDDGELVDRTAEQIVGEMRGVPNLTNIRSSAELLQPELRITPLANRAALLGVSVADISATTRVATLGEIDSRLAKFDTSDRQVPIRVQVDRSSWDDPRQIGRLRVRTAAGTTVPLDSVAEIRLDSGISEIKRYQRERQVTVGADTNGAPLGPALHAVRALPSLANLPPGVRLSNTGDAEIMGEVQANFGMACAAGMLMVFAVLVLLFGSFLQPLTIMMTLPLSIGGACGALLLTGDSMSLSVLIGLLMLMGIVSKNAILFLDYALLSIRERNLPRHTALLEAGEARAQPILMTTIAMVAGMAPIAARLGNQSDFNGPMAVTVIGGLIVSTLLSLVFVPVIFTFVDDCQLWLVRTFETVLPGRRVAKAAPERIAATN